MPLFKPCVHLPCSGKETIFSKWFKLSSKYDLREKMRFPISFPDKDINYYLKMLKGDLEEQHKLKPVLKSLPERGTIILFRSKTFGTGDNDYSEKLLKKFAFALTKASIKPKMVIAVNEGVFLMTGDSPILSTLRILEKQGVLIYVSADCLDFYKCSDTLKIGNPVDIYEISDYLLNSTRLISP